MNNSVSIQPRIDRQFMRLADGRLLHWRSASPAQTSTLPPLLLMHAGPGSSAGLVPLIQELAAHGHVIAPDTPGYGDSEPPVLAAPALADYADRMVELLDGLGVEQVDVCGQHTGAHIGCELALRHPARVRRLMLDGIALFEPELLAQMRERYAPPVVPDDIGSHLNWAWHFVEGLYLHFPYFQRDAAHRLHHGAVPPAGARQALVLDLLKALPHYQQGYQAVYAHHTAQRLALLRHRTLFIAAQGDPLGVYLDAAAALVLQARAVRPTRSDRGAVMLDFMRSAGAGPGG